MAAASQSKNLSSCSPIPIKPTKPRNSEISNPMRRSLSGSPFVKPSVTANQRPGFKPNTSDNRLSDYPRRNSISGENIVISFRDPQDKENNNKDQNSKGTKNFMSPTISATSRINASPRKKILTERNEPPRTSVSSSDGKAPLQEDIDLKPEKSLIQKKEVSFDPTITYLENNEAFSDNQDLGPLVNSHIVDDCDSFSESLAVENDFVNLDPSFNNSPWTSCSLSSPALAPLDADPLMPPYDPKTNYLSPRPQFLHYKPNPRIKLYLDKERDGKQLEGSFSSETSSDDEVIGEETVADEISSNSQKESDSGDLVKEEKEEEEEKENEEEVLLVSEPNPINSLEGAVEARRVLKPHFLTRTKFTALLFVLAIAGLWASISNSPVMDPSVLNNLNFPNPYLPPEISEFIRDTSEGIAQKFRQWLYNSLSYMHNLIFSFIERHKPGPLQFANLTILLEDSSVDNHLLVDQSAEVKYERKEEVDIQSLEKEEVDEKVEQVANTQSLEEEEAGEKVEQVAEIQSFEEDNDKPAEGNENIEEDSNVAEVNTEEITSNKDQEFEDEEVIAGPDINFEVAVTHFVPESEEESTMTQVEVTQERVNTVGDISELQGKTDVIEQPVPILKVDEIEPEVSDPKQSLAENVVSSAEIESTTAELDAITMKPESAGSMEGIKNLVSVQAAGISLLVLSLLAIVPFLYVKNRTSTPPNAVTAVDRVPIAKSPLSVTPGITVQERSSRRLWQTEVETLRESCPSEMSSFQYSSSCSKRENKRTSEAQSHERRPKSNNRRESLASSDCSMGSASYGSFTTYEKLPIKQGNGDEGFFTPVRRSSRIRNHVTSP